MFGAGKIPRPHSLPVPDGEAGVVEVLEGSGHWPNEMKIFGDLGAEEVVEVAFVLIVVEATATFPKVVCFIVALRFEDEAGLHQDLKGTELTDD